MRIGELADLVGISTRAVRHYHRVGLLPEPARRTNGYREYSLRDAVELARVRRLVELGLSLGEVGDVLAGDAERNLAEILRELDADLAGQEADIRRRRVRLAQLLRQAEAGMPSEQAPVSPGLAGFFGCMAEVAAGQRPGPESAMAAKDLLRHGHLAPPAQLTVQRVRVCGDSRLALWRSATGWNGTGTTTTRVPRSPGDWNSCRGTCGPSSNEHPPGTCG